MKLNPQQSLAVKHIDGPLLVLAGAGSGKTGVITKKIAYLIERCDIQPRHIFAVTFTNKAAREMQSRVKKLLKNRSTDEPSISTFHSLGLRIIREEHTALNLKRNFTILDPYDVFVIIKDISKQTSNLNDKALKTYQWKISQWKNDLIFPDTATKQAKTSEEIFAAKLYEQYEKTLQIYNAVDFDDLILRPAKLFQQNPEILDKWRNHIRYLLVDEYQDTNSSQYELVKQLTHIRQQLTVVGDDDQSIYEWRGAKAENLKQLKVDFPTLQVIMLEQNYRSCARILKSANQLIANNSHLFEKRLWSRLEYGDPIKIVVCRDDKHEAERVVSEIIQHKLKNRGKHSDYAILYRGNFQSRVFERALRNQEIPYHLSGGTSFFDRSEIKDIFSYIRLILNPDDDSAFLRVINLPRRGIGTQTIEGLSQYAEKRRLSLLASIAEIGLEQHLADSAIKRLREFHHFITRKEAACNNTPASKIVSDIISDISYDSWLLENNDKKLAARKAENLTELVDWFGKLEKNDETLADITNKILLLNRLDNNDNTENQVQLMTLHAAKGLEFPYVFLAGMEEGLLPHQNNIDTENIAEERRLAYVGITRAKKHLMLTLTKQRKRQGKVFSCTPSRFIDELCEEDLQWHGEGIEKSEAEAQETAKSHLLGLKSLLAD